MSKNTYRPMSAIEADAMGYKVNKFDLASNVKGNEFFPWNGGSYWLPVSSLQTDHEISISQLID